MRRARAAPLNDPMNTVAPPAAMAETAFATPVRQRRRNETATLARRMSRAHGVLMGRNMAKSDRAFRGLARSEPNTILSLTRVIATALVPPNADVTPEMVDDPHVQAPPIADADWVARIEPGELLHLECQGYRGRDFPSRLFKYHL